MGENTRLRFNKLQSGSFLGQAFSLLISRLHFILVIYYNKKKRSLDPPIFLINLFVEINQVKIEISFEVSMWKEGELLTQ